MSSLPQDEGAGALRMSVGAESLRRLSHASLSSLMVAGGGGREPGTSRSLPDDQPGPGQDKGGWGGMTKAGLLVSLATQGNQKLSCAPGRGLERWRAPAKAWPG